MRIPTAPRHPRTPLDTPQNRDLRKPPPRPISPPPAPHPVRTASFYLLPGTEVLPGGLTTRTTCARVPSLTPFAPRRCLPPHSPPPPADTSLMPDAPSPSNPASRVVILSDTHIGRPGHGASDAASLRPLWQNATHLIMNGDTAEIHDPRWRPRAARQVLLLQDLCERDRVRLTLLSGNHDPMISDQRFLTLHDNAVFITHGDVLHPAISPWNFFAPQLQTMHDRALASLDLTARGSLSAQLDTVQFVAHQAWDNLVTSPRPPQPRLQKYLDVPAKAARVFWYWATIRRRALEFLHRHAPDARFFIFGHYHHAGVWPLGPRVIINTGCYIFPLKPLAVIIENLTLSVWPVRRVKSEYRFAPGP